MKVISILQPWASLIVLGHKKIETRSWNTKYRGEILIHASAKKLKYDNDKGIPEECYKAMCKLDNFVQKYSELCPHGSIIGKATLVDTMKSADIKLLADCNTKIPLNGNLIPEKWEQEIAFGDYSHGRYGWLLSDAVCFKTPIPAKGKLGIWDYELPDHFHYPIEGGGHATFPTPPSRETIDAVNTTVALAKKLKKT